MTLSPEKAAEVQAIWNGLTNENKEAMLDYLEMMDIAYREENCIPIERIEEYDEEEN